MEDDNEDSEGEASDQRSQYRGIDSEGEVSDGGERVPSKGKDNHARTIIHIDIDCFYATVEILLNPELKGKPIGIQQKHLLVTCSYEARAMGVEKCMSMVKALEVCPNIIIINGEDLYKYREMSEAIYSILQCYTPMVEKLGLDENWVDISTLISEDNNKLHDDTKLVGHLYGEMNSGEKSCRCGCVGRITKASRIAQEIRNRLQSELGVTCSAGISYNKVLSKLVGAMHKPNQQTSIFPCSALDFIRSKSLKHLPGIGQVTNTKLKDMKLDSVDKVRQANEFLLVKSLGLNVANFVMNICYGIDDSPVRIASLSKSIGIEDGFRAVTTVGEIVEKVRVVLQRLWILVAKDGRVPSQMKVTIRRLIFKPEPRSERKSCILSFDSSLLFHRNKANQLTLIEENKLVEFAMELFNRLTSTMKEGWHITLIGISFSNFGMNSQSSHSSKAETSMDQYFKGSRKNNENLISHTPSYIEPTAKNSFSNFGINSQSSHTLQGASMDQYLKDFGRNDVNLISHTPFKIEPTAKKAKIKEFINPPIVNQKNDMSTAFHRCPDVHYHHHRHNR